MTLPNPASDTSPRHLRRGHLPSSPRGQFGLTLPAATTTTGSVLFNACAPELWRRFTITLRRMIARQAGLTNKALAAQLRVSFAKVAEYQRRGVVHFHAIIRLDGPNGPDTAPPAWATVGLLTAAIAQAAASVHLDTPAAPGLPARTLCWGREHDTRPITTTGDLTDTRVAAYVAKYATKAAECTGTLDRRITPTDSLAELPVSEHARRVIATSLRLGKLPRTGRSSAGGRVWLF